MLEDPLSKVLHSNPPRGDNAVCTAPSEGALPVAAMFSGWGDGTYPVWFGHAADGSVSVVLMDFLVAGDPWTAQALEEEERAHEAAKAAAAARATQATPAPATPAPIAPPAAAPGAQPPASGPGDQPPPRRSLWQRLTGR